MPHDGLGAILYNFSFFANFAPTGGCALASDAVVLNVG